MLHVYHQGARQQATANPGTIILLYLICGTARSFDGAFNQRWHCHRGRSQTCSLALFNSQQRTTPTKASTTASLTAHRKTAHHALFFLRCLLERCPLGPPTGPKHALVTAFQLSPWLKVADDSREVSNRHTTSGGDKYGAKNRCIKATSSQPTI